MNQTQSQLKKRSVAEKLMEWITFSFIWIGVIGFLLGAIGCIVHPDFLVSILGATALAAFSIDQIFYSTITVAIGYGSFGLILLDLILDLQFSKRLWKSKVMKRIIWSLLIISFTGMVVLDWYIRLS